MFYEVTTFGTLAENVAQTMAKGDRVIVTGRGELDRWTGKDGQERTTKKVLADACGPDLRFGPVVIARADRRQGHHASQATPDDEPF